MYMHSAVTTEGFASTSEYTAKPIPASSSSSMMRFPMVFTMLGPVTSMGFVTPASAKSLGISLMLPGPVTSSGLRQDMNFSPTPNTP